MSSTEPYLAVSSDAPQMHKHLEEALRHSEEKYRSLVDSIDEGFCVIEVLFDNDGKPFDYRFLEINTAFERQTGLGDAVGKTMLEMAPAHEQHWFDIYGRIALTGEALRFENRADALGHWYDVYAYRYGEPEKRQVAVLFNDIKERKMSELAAREAHERTVEILESISDAFYAVDAQFRFTYVNHHAAKLWDADAAAIIGRDLWSEFPQIIGTKAEKMHRFAHAERQMVRYDILSPVMGIWVEVSIYPDRRGGLSVYFRDISERKKIEETLRAAHAQSEETNRMKDEFLATLGHELRTPLNAILGWSNLLRTNELDAATQTQGLETIERNARSQSQLINDLLDVSRILTGKLRLEMRPIELAEVIESAVNTVLPSAQAKSIRIRTSIDHSTGLISGDPDRLGQIFWNLLTNAIKFTPRGGRIDIDMERVDSGVQVDITDSGQGIAPEFLPYVFERFRQADASSTRSYGGLGIGLALVRHLMEAHGGTVSVTSPGEGHGSTFTITFPLSAMRPDVAPEPQQHGATLPPLENSEEFVLPPLSGLHILVVDDEADARSLIQLALMRRGAQVDVADSVAAAIERIHESRRNGHPYDVLVSDIGMPGEDGYSLIRRVRHEEEQLGGFLPAIALTAYATHNDRMRALMAGFQIHVAKPVEPLELVATIASLTGRMGQDAET